MSKCFYAAVLAGVSSYQYDLYYFLSILSSPAVLLAFAISVTKILLAIFTRHAWIVQISYLHIVSNYLFTSDESDRYDFGVFSLHNGTRHDR
jgi:hypothetical protein